MDGRPLRFLVLSDLHAFEGEPTDKSPSTMAFGHGQTSGQDRLHDCATIVAQEFDGIDAVLVAGDLTNGADREALIRVWDVLNEVADRLGAKLVATAGNHDYDSRHGHSPNPRGDLIGLDPPFPLGTEDAKLQYFTYDFAFSENENFLVATLNSAAQHGYMIGEKEEYDHGRVMPETIARIKGQLASRSKLPRLKILLVHHHLVQLPDMDTAEQSVMIDAQPLMQMLYDHDDWLIIHGHKHRGYIQYAGQADGLTVVSAGTFAANNGGGNFSAATRSQFYVLEIPAAPANGDQSLVGTIWSWTHSGLKWDRSGTADGLPGHTGFGLRGNVTTIASEIRNWLEGTGGSATRSEIIAWKPELDYLIPIQIAALKNRLANGGVQIDLQLDVLGRIDTFDTIEKVEADPDGQ